ncbi:transmembrane protein 186 [Linepithema humile]|uniref:transmembrane protein 186 n=1 Tax=Linepithema humile TaxID=83485 RepID=UPI00062370F6|nr:PREDICTED: transmembrane protein 186 [Linepithema humile]
MYPRLLLNLCERSLCRASSSFKFPINRLSHALNKREEKPNTEIVSTRFSDYKIIYTFPYIKHVRAINVVKRRLTFFVAAAVPVIVGLHLADIISFDIASSSIASGILLTTWLHSLGIFCNNLIGCVYVKLDEEKVILSYMNYWGKRTDLETTLSEIIPLSDNQFSIIDPLYRKVQFATKDQKLKINLKLGQITDIKNFKCVLGTI